MTNTANKIRRFLAVLLTLTLLFSSSAQSFILNSAAYAEGETNTETMPDGNEAPAGEETPASGDDATIAGEDAQGAGDDTPEAGEDMPAEGDDTPQAGDDNPADGNDTPQAGEDTPADGDSTPAANDVLSDDGNVTPDNDGSGEDTPAGETAGQDGTTDQKEDAAEPTADEPSDPADGEGSILIIMQNAAPEEPNSEDPVPSPDTNNKSIDNEGTPAGKAGNETPATPAEPAEPADDDTDNAPADGDTPVTPKEPAEPADDDTNTAPADGDTPVTPEEPAEPADDDTNTAPADGDTPVTPEEPDEPADDDTETTPADGDTPVTPEEPDEPADDDTDTTPADGDTPVTPDEPAEPADDDTDTAPADGDTLVTPEEPAEPADDDTDTTPADGDTPLTPDEPADPADDDTETAPTDGDTPVTPEEPAEPADDDTDIAQADGDMPVTPEEPAEPTEAAADNPNTAPADSDTPVTPEEPAEPAEPAAYEADPADVILISSGEEMPEETPEKEPIVIGEPRTIEKQVGDHIISVYGALPVGVELQAVEIPAETAEAMCGRSVYFAYDIRLVVNGQVWQPADYGIDVKVTVRSLNGDRDDRSVDILHVKTDLLDADGNLSDEAVQNALQELSDGNMETEKLGADRQNSTISFDTSSFSGFLANAVPVLQDMVNKALAAKESLSGKVQVVLSRNVNYEGDVTMSAGNREVADDFELEISAEDAGDDGMDGDGTAVVNGKIAINGIKVILNSVMVALGKLISVQAAGSDAGDQKDRGGTLIYNGTQNKINEVTVEVGKNSSAEITTLGDNDVITATTKEGAKSLKINAGDGQNQVTANISGGDAEILTGKDVDTVSVNLNDAGAKKIGAVSVDTGSGNDTVSIRDNGTAKSAEINTGDGDDNITVDVRANAGDMTINTGLGGDTVSVIKGDHHSVENINYSQTQQPYENIRNADAGATVSFVNGDEDAVDRFTVDVAAAGGIKRIDLSGGKGASVHLKGDLKPWSASDTTYNPITGTASDLTLHTVVQQQTGIFSDDNDLTLNITTHSDDDTNYNFTDALTGKKTVYVFASKTTEENGKKTFTYDAGNADDFTDYVFKTPVNKLDSIVFNAANKPLLSNVVLDAAETLDEDEAIKVKDLKADNMNVLLKGASIDITGTVTAQNLRAESVQGIATMGQAFGNLMKLNPTEDGSTSLNINVKKTIEDMISLIDRAHITIADTANITTENDIVTLSRIKQFGKILSFIPDGFNIANVKIASASVKIDGKLTSTKGSVTADAQIETTTGKTVEYDDFGNETSVTKAGAQISANVIIDEAAVKVGEKATIKAAEDILLNSKSATELYNYATFGTISTALPATVAVTFILNDVKTRIGGTLEAGRSVKANAEGIIKDETSSSLGNMQKAGTINAFLSVNIVNQDVDATIENGANVKAGGNVSVHSTAIADVQTIATSEVPKEKGEAAPQSFTAQAAGTIASIILTPVKEVILKPLSAIGSAANTVTDRIGEWWSDGQRFSNKIDDAIKKIEAGAYSVNVIEPDPENAEKGSATVSVKLRKDISFKLDKYNVPHTPNNAETLASQLCAVVSPEPKDGYAVAKVQYRYLLPGADHYTYVTVEPDNQNRYIFTIDHSDIEVLVTYKAAEAGSQPQQKPELDKDEFEDVYDLSSLFTDSMDSSGGNADDDDDFQMDGDAETHTQHQLAINPDTEGGKILTWRTNDQYENLTTVYGGQTIRFVANPNNDKTMLKELLVSYSTKDENGNKVPAVAIVTADSEGRYLFTVPDNMPDGERIYVTATFDAKPEDVPQPSRYEIGGAIAVGVVLNDNDATIQSGATVNAGGKLDMLGVKRTVNDIIADGSAVKEGSGGAAETPKEGEDIPTVLSSFTDPDQVYQIPGAEYAVKVNSSLTGEIKGSMDKKDGGSQSHPTITFKPDQTDWSKVKVVVSYYTKMDRQLFTGTRVTSEETIDKSKLAVAADGTVTYTPSMGSYTVKPGTTMEITLVFLDAQGNAIAAEGMGASDYIVNNPIEISYNALTKNDESGAMTKLGKVTPYSKPSAKEGRYYVHVEVTKTGYKIDSDGEKSGTDYTKSNTDKLYATWRADGEVYKAALKHDSGDTPGVWYFDTEDGNIYLPAGAVVTITAVFEEDTHGVVKAEKALDTNGKEISKDQVDVSKAVSIDKSSAKAADNVKVSVKAMGEWYPSGITVSYRGYDGPEALRGIADRSFTVTQKDEKGNFVFTMPQLTDVEEATLKVTPTYARKEIPIKVEGSTGAKDTSAESIKLSETSGKGFKGEAITVSPSDELAKEGYKVTGITVSYNGQTQNYTSDTFSITQDYSGSSAQNLQVHATLELKTAKIESHTDIGLKGVMEPATERADSGETVIINIIPMAGYRLKYGTGRAVVDNGSGTQQVVMTRVGENKYSFVMPGGINKNTVVTLRGEFEEGSDGSDVNFSMGMGIAVGVTSADNHVVIEGDHVIESNKIALGNRKVIDIEGAKVSTGSGVSLTAKSIGGKASTQAKAGFNQGNTGVAGALAVQVALYENKAAIEDGASIGIDDGSISLSATTKQEFKVVGDASGKKDGSTASGTGVGAGIAVAVNDLETEARLEDGVELFSSSDPKKLPHLTGISIKATAKTKDTVTAKAGAAGGGTAVVPVAAVDVFNNDTNAYLGKLDILDDTLPVYGKVDVKATADSNKVQYNHEVTADASAAGGKTALGGAFIVTWISNQVNAKLNQSIKGTGDISVNARGGDALKAVATASASGGADGAKNDAKQGKADKQANSLLGGAANLSGKYGKESGGGIMNEAGDRQKAETAEQSISGAGAFVLNMQRNKVRAEIMDNVNIDTTGKVTVHSANRTDATIKANASATKSDVGVGVGIALNIVKMDNIARVGNGKITAAGLEIVADIAEAPTKTRTVTVVEGESGFKAELTTKLVAGIREMVGEDVFPYIEPMVSAGSTFVSTFYNKLIQDLNLQDLFNASTDGLGGSFEHAAEQLWEKLQNFPKALISPVMDVIDQAMAGMPDWDADAWKKKVLDLLDTAWKAAIIQNGGDAFTIFKDTFADSKDALIGCVLDAVADKMQGQPARTGMIQKTLYDTIGKAFKKIADAAVKRMVTEISKELPIVNATNVELVKSLKDMTMEQIAGSIVPYITETFRKEVYDYEPLMTKIEAEGFLGFLEEELRGLLKESTVAMTNEAIDKVLGKLDVKFDREAIEDRHVVTTQAISGAGAKTTSAAGSLAIAVVNMDTRAEIAEGKGKIDITGYGDLVVKAEEARRIRTHSTAAVDAKGEADNNEGAGDTEEAQTGGSGAAQEGISSKDGMVTVVSSTGGSVAFGDTEDGRLYLTPDKGYKISSKNIIRTYTTTDGDEVIDTVTLEEYGDDYLVIPTEGAGVELLDEDQKKSFHISLDIQFEEDLRAIPAVSFMKKDDNEYVKKFKDSGKEITYSVEGKEGSDKVGKAKEGDLVEITIPQVDELDPYEVCVYDGSGNMIARYELEPQYAPKLPAGAQVMTKVSANANETVLAFRMTDKDIGKVELDFSEGFSNWGKKAQNMEDIVDLAGNDKEKSQETDRAGRKVGVGAAFTLTYGNSDVKAIIGERTAGVSAGSVAVTASSDHEEENFATAGSDPLKGVNASSDSEKDMGLDASVSINILDNDIRAAIEGNTKVTTTIDKDAADEEDGDEEEPEADEDGPEPIKVTRGSVVVDSTELSYNETKASAFATGSTTAVGASVAVNIALSDIETEIGGDVDAAGKVAARSYSLSEDNTWSFASAMGADMQRNMNKVSKYADTASDAANSVTTGSAFDKKAKDEEDKKKSNDTSKKITNRLNNDKVKSKDGSEASENLSVSTNVQRSMGSKFDAGSDAQSESNGAGSLVNEHGGQSLGGSEEKKEDAKLQVAATVGVTVALHDASVKIGREDAKEGNKIKAGEGVSLIAQNAGNFNSRATAAAMGLEDSHQGTTIAAAVGVSVNNNKATVDVYGGIEAAGDVDIAAELTQNMTGDYRGKLAVQSISGAVSGKNTEKSIAGAISMLVSHATSRAAVHGFDTVTAVTYADKIEGANVSITATDESKLGVRAGGVNYSKGAATGMGLSSATIWSGNDVEANLGGGIKVTADSFTLDAHKKGIDLHDYQFPLGWQDLISDSSDLDDEERENVYTGLIDVHRKPGEKSYTVDVNMDTYTLMKIPDMLNGLATNSYYAEAIAGSVVGKGEQDGENNLAGSVSIVRTNNTVNATVGYRTWITTRNTAAENAVRLNAQDDNNTRLLGGALSAGSSKNTIGGIITFLSATDTVKVTTDDDVTIDAGSVAQNASGDVSVQTFNAAAAVNNADEGNKTVGAAIDILLLNNKVENNVGFFNSYTSGTDIDLTAKAEMELITVAASLAAAKKATAAGGTIQFVNDKTKASVSIDHLHSLIAGDNISINAEAKDKIISVIASASGAPEADKGSAIAGSLNVINAGTKGLVSIGDGRRITATKGDVAINADTEANVINVTAAMAGSGGKAVGLSANVNVFNRESEVDIKGGEGYVIKAGGNVQTSASGNDFTVMAGLAASGATGEGNAISGNLPIVVGLNTVKDTLGKAQIDAGGSAAITSNLKDRAYLIAGTIALSNAGNAMGATAMTVVKENTVKTELGDNTITAGGGKTVKIATTGEDYRGVYTDAKVRQTLVAGAAGISAGGDKGVTANVVTVVSGNEVKTDASAATLNAGTSGNTSITVKAENDSCETVFAGGISIGKSMGAGASVVVAVARNDVKAQAHDLTAGKDVNVIADNDDQYILLNVNLGASAGNAAELGVTVTSLESKANAEVASKVTAKDGTFNLKANNTTDITNVAVAVAASSKNAATPVFVYTGFSGETNAMLKAGTVEAKNVNIAADSGKDVDQYTVGMSASGSAALSGAVSILKLSDKTNALVSAPVSVTAGKMDVTADSDYKLVGASGAIAASGKAGIAVNAMVSVVKAATLAEMAGKATVQTNGLKVKASSKRDIINAALSVGAGGSGGGGSVGVMVLVAGDKMDQEAADQLTYGNATKKDTKLFDVKNVIQNLKNRGINTSSMEEQKDKDGNVTRTGIGEDLEGNGQTTDTKSLGHSEGSGKTFDVASGYNDGTDGEKSQASETEDVKRAKTVGSTVYSDSPKDSVIARISESADITGSVSVEAAQTTLADMYGASVGIGGKVGGGISVAVAKLRSNVFATSLGTIHANGGDVRVQAVSDSAEAKADSDEQARSAALKKSLLDKINPTKRSIRAVGLAVGGGGEAGAGVAAGFVRLDNITQATLAGRVEKAGNIDVAGKAQYDNVLAVTLAAGGGSTAGIAGSFAIAVADGTVNAMLGRNHTRENAVHEDGIFEQTSGNINVTTHSVFGANAIAVSAADGGYVGAVGGLAQAKNNLTQNTTVEREATLANAAGNGTLNVKGTSTSTANGYLMGLSAGIGAVGIGVSLVNVKPTLNTTVGVAGSDKGTTALSGYQKVNIANDVVSAAESNLLSAAIGGVSVGVNVMNVYNDTKATAKAANLSGSTDELNVSGLLGAKGESNVAAVSASGIGIGVSVNYVDVNSRNLAQADLTNSNISIAKKLSVTTGDANYSHQTSATTNSLSAAVGVGVIGVTTSVARNRAVNEAEILGKTLTADEVNLNSYSKGSTTAKLIGASVGGINIVTSVVNALNETASFTRMNLSGAIQGTLTARSDVQGETNAKLLTGAGSIIGIDTNVATANGRTTALADIAIGGSNGKKQKIDSQVTGKDTVKTTIENLIGLNVGLSVATMVGGAHNHDVYNNQVKLSNGTYDLSGVTITTDYTTTADSNVTPSSAGVNLNLIGVAVNQSSATSDAYAGAELTLEKAKAGVDGDLNIRTTGTSNVTGVVKPASFDWSLAVGVGVNKAKAESKGTQAAVLYLNNGQVTRASAVNVESIVKAADAYSTVSANGKDKNASNKRVKISAVSVDNNTSDTRQSIASTAAIRGKNTAQDTISTGSLSMKASSDKAATAEARTDGAYNVGLVTAGHLNGEAYTGMVYNVLLDKVKATVSGDVSMQSRTSGNATVVGAMPGSLSALSGLHSNIKAGIGTDANRQTSKVLITAGTVLNAGGLVSINAYNTGDATASFRQGTSISLAKSADSKQPVESWYETGVVIGDGAEITAGENITKQQKTFLGTMNITNPALRIYSSLDAYSDSTVNAKSIGLLMNTNNMKGEVSVQSNNNIDIGKNVKLSAKGTINIIADNDCHTLAKTDLSGGGIYDGTESKAVTTITRNSLITIDKGTSIQSENSNVYIKSQSGDYDDIQVIARVEAGGAITIAHAKVDATVTSNNEIHIREGVNIAARKDVDIITTAQSSGGEMKNGSGIYVYPKAKSYGLGVAPEAKAVLTMNFNALTYINMGGSERVKITSSEGNINIYANNEGLHVYSDPGSDGKAAGGTSKARTDIIANLKNIIWIDAADITAKKTLSILANNGNTNRALIEADTLAELYSAGGVVRAENYIKGILENEIRSNNTKNVTLKGSSVVHKAVHNVRTNVDFTRKRAIITTSKKGGNNWEWKYYDRCDFCGTTSSTKGYNPSAWYLNRNGRDANAAMNGALKKALAPINDIRRMVNAAENVYKARYGELENQAAAKLFVLDIQSILLKDVRLESTDLAHYRMWTNSETYHDVYMMPNAAQLYMSGNKLQYVADIMSGSLLSGTGASIIAVISALTKNAFDNPLFPMGSTGTLNFLTGELVLPSYADYELYLHEVSGKWLTENMMNGFIRTLIADRAALDEFAANGGELPEGIIIEGLTEDDESGWKPEGWRIYWVGDSPATVQDPDQMMICVAWNPETDEIDAGRISLNMIENGEEPIDISLYLYRNSKADREEDEKYDCFWFDTPEGESSLVKVITDVIWPKVLETPKPIHVILRSFTVPGADYPAYSLTGYLFVMSDVTDGSMSLLDGEYEATYHEGVFDSGYTRIEGILDGTLIIIFRKDQPVWPEWITSTTAEDIGGRKYMLEDGEWVEVLAFPVTTETPEGTETPDAVEAI